MLWRGGDDSFQAAERAPSILSRRDSTPSTLRCGFGRCAPRRPALKLLILDTCGTDASFELLDGPELVSSPDRVSASDATWEHHLVTLEGRTASERLLPELRRALSELGWMLKDLASVAVVSGPGSFTGVRIGLAVAKGLCEGARLPLVTVSRLAVLARKGAGFPTETVHAVLDAGRGEFFYGRFAPGRRALENLLTRNDLVQAAAAVAGNAVVCEPSLPPRLPELRATLAGPLTAADAFPLVLEDIQRGSYADLATADPNYLRRTDLEVLENLRRRVARL